MIHEIIPVGMLGCNCSVIGDETSREAMVIDPGDNVEQILGILQRDGLTLKTIVVTHAHIDHIGGAARLRAATGAPVYMHQDDAMLSDQLDMQASARSCAENCRCRTRPGRQSRSIPMASMPRPSRCPASREYLRPKRFPRELRQNARPLRRQRG